MGRQLLKLFGERNSVSLFGKMLYLIAYLFIYSARFFYQRAQSILEVMAKLSYDIIFLRIFFCSDSVSTQVQRTKAEAGISERNSRDVAF